MRAILISSHGGPDVLKVADRPDPVPNLDQVLIEVKAFGLNHAEIYFRSGAWGDVAEITGIECVGLVRHDPRNQFRVGQKVIALVGGLGRDLNGSYAELVAAPRSNVVTFDTELSWAELAALPESYATAWSALMTILHISPGQSLLVRGATSALGQAAVNIAHHLGLHVLGTTRQQDRFAYLEALGVDEVFLEGEGLSHRVRSKHPDGVDAVLDIIGNRTILDSLAALKRGGEVCQVGFLGGGGPLALEPVFQIPSGRKLSVFASALVLGGPEFPLSEIPFQKIVRHVEQGAYKAKPARVFDFEDIVEAHRLIEAGTTFGKLVVQVGV
ncbi:MULTISPECIES: zinc-binding dehydrogenase [unclassified Rhizobium]|mgnify:CR=1 FL=1|jgi:NADPH2:quinone reductase|uniref:zinc-binding dehydrogenase n=1 Tax=unclassified Rhizobium TaxID=2613769 RepID=UPI000646CECE|nr:MULTISPECIES: zinc-binding dehydrogenase [unclassified Rhizobium]MBN8951190.1 zinc-binding dehydrogenase [Rhizobium tropici]OJY74974.1 MAG: alcohol dehydrogenase [Rhizobium sp. 60-20]RKD66491.1 NADPH:quinone reductase-like Zn-dependent oxidoreductase [Rhizobium sp. WW_1]